MDTAGIEQIIQLLAERNPQVQALDSVRFRSAKSMLGLPSVANDPDWWYQRGTEVPEANWYVIRTPQAQGICNTMAGTPGTAHLGCTQRDATMDGQPYAKIIVPDIDPGDNIFNHEARHAKGYQHK